jgi:hypothetical protein
MRVLSFLFLSVLLLNMFGFYTAFMVKQGAIHEGRSELTVMANEASHPSITLSKYNFERVSWIREGKEFRHEGKLYDVSKIEFVDGQVKIFVEEDSLETNLINDFIAVLDVQTEKGQNNSPVKLLLEHFLKEFVIEKSGFVFEPTVSCLSLAEPGSVFNSFIPNTQAPPPDLA